MFTSNPQCKIGELPLKFGKGLQGVFQLWMARMRLRCTYVVNVVMDDIPIQLLRWLAPELFASYTISFQEGSVMVGPRWAPSIWHLTSVDALWRHRIAWYLQIICVWFAEVLSHGGSRGEWTVPPPKVELVRFQASMPCTASQACAGVRKVAMFSW